MLGQKLVFGGRFRYSNNRRLEDARGNPHYTSTTPIPKLISRDDEARDSIQVNETHRPARLGQPRKGRPTPKPRDEG